MRLRLLRLRLRLLFSSGLLVTLQFREIKGLTADNGPSSPGDSASPRSPEQSAHPGLNIPPNVESHVLALRKTSRDVADLVLALLATQAQHTRSHSLLLLGGLAWLRIALLVPSRGGCR